MFKKIIILMFITFFFAGYCVAEEQIKPENLILEFNQATCNAVKSLTLPAGQVRSVPVLTLEGIEKSDGFSCTMGYPLMTERLASYGRIKQSSDRTGFSKRQFDTSQDNLLTAAGRELYKELMAIKVGKLFAISHAPIGYSTVMIVPFEQVPRDDGLLEPIRAAFEKAAKLDAATD